MKLIFVFFPLLFFHIALPQSKRIQKLKLFIEKGICKEESNKCEEQQLKYLKACKKIGNYYNKWGNDSTALIYYRLASDLEVYTDGELQSNNTIRLRNAIALKAGKIYLSSDKLKKDTLQAFYMYNKMPANLSNETLDKYSALFFGNTNHFFGDTRCKNIFSKDSTWSLGINPFYLNDKFAKYFLLDCLNEVASKCLKNEKLKIKIEISYGILILNTLNQNYLNILRESIDSNLKLNCQKKYEIEIIATNDGYFYKSLMLPKISFKLVSQT